jgi:hypothetical protein
MRAQRHDASCPWPLGVPSAQFPELRNFDPSCRGGRTFASHRHVTVAQRNVGGLFNAGTDLVHDGGQFDHLLGDDEAFQIGGLQVRAMDSRPGAGSPR